MSSIKRRHFLQFAGSTLAAIGLSQFDFLRQGDRYARVLAQSTPRKLALLVGINHYPSQIGELKGCFNDVELQKHLLIHRFGFKSGDILELTDSGNIQPTRANILQAFENHLVNQAKPGDIVVFHYSGHGDRIKDIAALNTAECQDTGDCQLNGTIVPKDAAPLSQQGTEVIVPDIMGRTLFLLTKAIDTDHVTIMLDSCHSGAGTRGDLAVRAARARSTAGQNLVPSSEEIEFQQRWLADPRIKLSKAEFEQQRQTGIAKGVAIGSARRDQLAIDAKFDGFYAGGFTYLLTRYLWQLTSNQAAETTYANLRRSTSSLAQTKGNSTDQVPIFEYMPDSNQQQPIYFTDLPTPPAEAVITSVNPLQFWLGGVGRASAMCLRC
jgi:Caspase domain